jgi:hypothetical protein
MGNKKNYYLDTETHMGVNDSDEVWVLGEVFGGFFYTVMAV